LAREAGALARISQFLSADAVLATGAASMEASTEGRSNKFYNSILLLDQSGLLAERYDKRRLVPLGEYVPLQALLRRTGLTEFVQFPGGFESGSGSDVLTIPGAPAALAMICYEAIFPYEWGGIRSGDGSRAKWILNVTDDAWFGLTPGPYQHFALARLRSIEWGLPMARSANGGISAIVDAKGRVLASAPLGDEAAIDGHLPGALEPTIAARWGSGPFAFGLAALAAILVAVPASRRRR
jgi:apolipoprotein N-acyltransferase